LPPGQKALGHFPRYGLFCDLKDYHSPAMHWTEHPRARVAYEERGRWIPTALYRSAFRAVIPLVLWWYRRAIGHNKILWRPRPNRCLV
jgi:hypothetical protein